MSTLMDIVHRHRLSTLTAKSPPEAEHPRSPENLEQSEDNKLSKLSTQHVEPWNDPEQFFIVMKAAGWTWPGVVAWLQVSASVGFFEVHPNDRHKAYVEFTASRSGAN